MVYNCTCVVVDFDHFFYFELFYTLILILQFPGVLAYCMSKSAIDQFTRCVALGKEIISIHPRMFFEVFRLTLHVQY